MTSNLLITILVVLCLILVDVFCGDITNTRLDRQNIQNSGQKSENLSNDKNTTPWPSLRQRWSENPNLRQTGLRSTTPGSRKWIQQNNIWIRNEQAASQHLFPQGIPGIQGSVGGRENANSGTTQSSVRSRERITGTQKSNNGPESIGGVAGNQRVPIHHTNRQQALIDGLGVNKQKMFTSSPAPSPQNVVSTTPKSNTPRLPTPTNKPKSYAGVVGPKSSPISPSVNENEPSFPTPNSPRKGDTQKNTGSLTGPTSNVEHVDTNQDDINAASDSSVTDDELREFSETLLKKDSNNAMKHVTINLQGMTTSRSTNDEAPEPLLKIDQAAFKIPSIEKLILLYNNYFLESSQNEVYTGQERIEENNLLDTILATPVMQYARSFLVQKGKIGKDPKEFRDLLRLLWFNMYSRGQGRIGSSGFEHVFLAEIKNSQVSGLHNWLYFNEEENQRRANYLGYMKKVDLGDKGAILKYHFTFHDIDKPVGSMFIGTSPELEIALYSTCFVLRADRICPLKMNGNRFIIRTYTYRYRGKNMIGSAFPEI